MTIQDELRAIKAIWIIALRLTLVRLGWTPRSKWTLSEQDLDAAYRVCCEEPGLRWLAVEILALRP